MRRSLLVLASLLAVQACDSSVEQDVDVSIQLRFESLDGDAPWWTEQAEVVQFPNFATLYVDPGIVDMAPLVVRDGRDDERKGAPYKEIDVDLGATWPVTITDRGAANGELVVQGRRVSGRSFYLQPNAVLLTSDAASETPVDRLLDAATGDRDK
ncbi:MAG: hypothetical protein AAF957_26810 [Planctomycetota bacterium]